MNDSMEETVYKIFEQIKAYNNRLSQFNKDQKDLIRDLKEMEVTMQRDTRYVHLKEELVYAETGLQEVEAKMKNLNTDFTRIIDQLSQLLYLKAQIK